jgi:hypothetical protein
MRLWDKVLSQLKDRKTAWLKTFEPVAPRDELRHKTSAETPRGGRLKSGSQRLLIAFALVGVGMPLIHSGDGSWLVVLGGGLAMLALFVG